MQSPEGSVNSLPSPNIHASGNVLPGSTAPFPLNFPWLITTLKSLDLLGTRILFSNASRDGHLEPTLFCGKHYIWISILLLIWPPPGPPCTGKYLPPVGFLYFLLLCSIKKKGGGALQRCDYQFWLPEEAHRITGEDVASSWLELSSFFHLFSCQEAWPEAQGELQTSFRETAIAGWVLFCF